jgi:hypothetical protein
MADYDKLIELDEKIKERYKNNAVLDGIVNFDKFIDMETNPKILWILKESNIANPETAYKNGCFPLNESLNEDISKHSNWKRTWELVMEISDAILHNAQDWQDEVPLIDRLLKEEVIKKIAVINIKKTGGGAGSDQKVINDFYQKDKDIINEQISAIAPDIIINASRVDALFNDLKISESKRIDQFDVAKFYGGIIINAYHPNQYNFSHKRYFELVRDCIKMVS